MYAKQLVIAIVALLVVSCKETKTKNKMENEISYSVTVNAPEGYPVEVHIGYLLDKNKELICGMPKAGTVTDGWEAEGKEGGQGGSVIPYYLNLTYVAYAEKKFYTVDAALPADKILEAFKKGYDHGEYNGTLVHNTYDYFTVGAAPGGVIVVWLGGAQNRTEICRLQAKEVVVSPDDFYRNPHEYNSQQFFDDEFNSQIPDSIKAEIAQKGIPVNRWEKYRTRFNYRFILESYNELDKFTHNYYVYFNGEADELLPKELVKNDFYDKSIPYHCTFIFTKYSTEIFFDYDEMLEIFNKFKLKYPNKPIDIIIKPTFMYASMKVSVKCENEIIVPTKFKVEGVWGA